MTRRLIPTCLAALGLVALPAVAAAQTMALATTDVNMRAGPGTGHAVVGVIPSQHPAVVHGCIADRTWCEVSYGPMTGWSRTRYLALDATSVAVATPPPLVAVAGPPADMTPASAAHPAAPLFGAAGGALAGGLIAGPPGAVIGGFTGALLTIPE